MPPIDWIAVLVAAVVSFAIGGVWYSPLLFTKAWIRESGVDVEQGKNANVPLIMGTAFALILLATIVFAMFLGPQPGLRFGAGAGFAAGLFWVAGSFGVNYLFEQRSFKLFLINGGYNVVMFTAMGAILGVLS